MIEIHITGIEYIEANTQEGIEFTYKADIPKLKLIGTYYEGADEDDQQGVIFLTQNQLNKLIQNKDIDLKVQDDGRWLPTRPLNKEQLKKIGLVFLEANLIGSTDDFKFFEITKVTE
jgi:hypothetical protein